MARSSPDVAAADGELVVRQSIDTPALIVDMDVLESNVREMAAVCQAGGVDLVPHVKTHRTVAFGQMQLQHGAKGLSVATMDEAEAFVDGGAPRIVYAYPLVGEAKIRRAEALARRGDVTVAADSLQAARAVGHHFAASGQTVDMYLIVDSGLHRCGVSPGEAAEMSRDISQIEGVRLTGIMTHEGSVYGSPDAGSLRANSLDVAQLMTTTANAVRAAGVELQAVSLGASASARVVSAVPGVTEVRPGMYAFNDLAQIGVGTAVPQTCAARVLATVVSRPAPDRAYIDAGSKSLSRDSPPGIGAQMFPGYGRIVGHPAWQIHALSEEHGWLRWVGKGSPEALQIGQQVQIIPNHICTVFSSMGESIGLRDGEVVGSWRTIRRTTPLLSC